MAKAQRVKAHQIETKSTDIIRLIINSSERGLYRELGGKDYGIDAVVEIFDGGTVTGKLGLIQCKGTEKRITPMIRYPDCVVCSGVSNSNLQYLKQSNTAVILVYASINERDNFYYVDLNEAIIKSEWKNIFAGKGGTKNVRIPLKNNAKENLDGFFDLIEKYYSSRKN